ncbi:MalM family protein [Corallincola platygyrae]|uniref:MalM family protein n=1 Tax=Corallincola platygyrae TaxID=1193278 RepID=A0ABW4XRT5_9GAMM
MGILRSLAIGVLVISFSISSASADWLDWFSGKDDTEQPLADMEQAKWELFNGQPCCESLSQLRYETLKPGSRLRTTVDTSAQIFEFKTGKSFVKSYRLPSVVGAYSLSIRSDVYEETTLFSPNVIVLNANFSPTRVFTSKTFTYTPARMLDPDNVSLDIGFNGLPPESPGAEVYLLVFTTEADLNGFTQMKHQLRVFAESQGRADPAVADPIAKHSPIGKLSLSINSGHGSLATDDPVDQFFSNMFGGDSEVQEYVDVPHPDEVPDSSPTPGLTSNVASGNVSMLPETEDLYNQLIEKAVANNEIDKAMKLVEEAERAGSRSARKIFIESVKNLR